MRNVKLILAIILTSLFVVSSVDSQGIGRGGISGGGVSLTTTQTISGVKTFTSTLNVQTDANSATEVLHLTVDPTTPANGDEVQIGFRLDPSGAGAVRTFGRIDVALTDVTDGAETSALGLDVWDSDGAGTMIEGFNLIGKTGQDEAVINEAGVDLDFRVEAVGQAQALFVRGSDGNVGIGTSNPDRLAHVAGAVDGDFVGLLVENSQANAAASTNETAQIRFGFGGINDVARISADKMGDYTTAAEEDSRLAFQVDIDGTPTMIAHFMFDGLMLMLPNSRIRFSGDAGGGGQAIQYKDTGGSMRNTLMFPGSDIVMLGNRAANGTVELRANTSTGGSGGEVTVAIIKDRRIDLVSGQIQFPATQLNSSNTETLDDYKEGTFTPTAIFAAGSGTITYTTQAGEYTKIGNVVFFRLELFTSSIALRTGDMTIGGLPFTSDITLPGSSVHIGFASGLAITAGMNITGNVNTNSSIIALRLWDATTGTTNLQDTEWTDGGRILLSGHYHVPGI